MIPHRLTRLTLAFVTLATATAIGARQTPAGVLAPRPGYIVGRAWFADGRPIPDFSVSAESGFGGAGKVQGSAGRYALQVTAPNIFIVQNILAKAVIAYQGQTYVLPLHPVDGLPDGVAANNFRGDVTKGVVRDFVLRLTGIMPGAETTPPPANVTDTDSAGAQAAFQGCQLKIELARESAPLEGQTLQLTMTPTGPLVDGSVARVIVRSIPKINPNYSYYFWDIPLGAYAVTASVTGPNGPTPLHLRMDVPTTNVTSGPAPLGSVAVMWPFDSKYLQMTRPVLTILR